MKLQHHTSIWMELEIHLLKLKAAFCLENYIALRFLPCIAWTI